ncbi:MAG: BON domain-containing protein [Sulfuriferula sp.]|nr:BON domain-containing protein [Sulfuriferula sp.]
MKITASFHKVTLGSLLIVSGLSIGFAGAACAADDAPAPQAHSDGVGAAISDTAITAKVKARLMSESGLEKSKISVTTTNGVVTLTGSASNEQAKSLAEDKTKTIEGVKSVDNALRTPGSSKRVVKAKRVVSDSWITTKVKSELLADSLSKGMDVSVETVHGVVVLKGTLANEDAIDHVKDLAGKVYGVKSVDVSQLKVGSK